MTRIRISFIERPGPNIRYAPGAFDGHIGREIPFHVPGAAVSITGRLVEADVIEDGQAVCLTFDVDDAAANVFRRMDPHDYSPRWLLNAHVAFVPIPAEPEA